MKKNVNSQRCGAVGCSAWLDVWRGVSQSIAATRRPLNNIKSEWHRLLKLFYLRVSRRKIMLEMLIVSMQATYLGFKCRIARRRLAVNRQQLHDALAEYCQVVKDQRLVIGIPHDLVDQLENVVASFSVAHTSNEKKISHRCDRAADRKEK